LFYTENQNKSLDSITSKRIWFTIMKANRQLDAVDLKILNILQKNARTSNAEISRQVNMAPSAVLERIRKLERSGVVQSYETRIDPQAMGLSLTAFTFVHAEETIGSMETGKRLSEVPGVMEIHYCAGQDAYLIKVRAADTEALSRRLIEIGALPTVRDTKSTIVLTTVKEEMTLPLPDEPEGIAT